LSADKAIYNYIKAIGKGLSKIMSKMGVSTYMSYCGAQLFEAIGQGKGAIHFLPQQLTATAVNRKGAMVKIPGHVAQGVADPPPVLGLKAQLRSRIWQGTRRQQTPFSATRP
jgi:hypothetical protein